MADILIRKVDDATKALLRRRAERNGRSLEAELRDAMVRLAHEEAESPDDTEPFGTWLASITQGGYDDFVDILEDIRASPMRPLNLD